MALPMHPIRGGISKDEAISALKAMDEQSFREFTAAYVQGRVAQSYQSCFASITQNDLEAVIQSRYPMTPTHVLTSLGIESARERECLIRAEKAERELESLKTRFESLFRIPVGHVTSDISQSPTHPGEWRIRLHVAAFTVDTTMGTLTVAKQNPKLTTAWGDTMAQMSELAKAAAHSQFQHIATHIITHPHPMESLEKDEPIEYRDTRRSDAKPW